MTTLDMSRAPLVIGPTAVAGLIEFQRADCGHYQPGACPECVEFATRGQLSDALRHVVTWPTARLGQTVLDESDIRMLLSQLDRYDATLRGVA